MKPNGVFNLILPAREIFHNHEPTNVLLAALDTSVRELIEVFLNAWAEMKQMSRYPEFNYGYLDYRTSLNINAQLLVADILFDAMEKRIEKGISASMAEDDRHAVERVIFSIWWAMSDDIFDLITELQLSDFQIAQLRFVRWLDNDLVISFPRHSRARE